MDDDKTLRVAFPIGETGDTLTLSEPTPAQRLTMSMLKLPEGADDASVGRMVKRLFMVLENVCGPGEWDKLNDGMASARYSVEDVLDLVRQMAGFSWSEADPGPVEPETPTAVAEAYIEERAKRPAPRVVGRA